MRETGEKRLRPDERMEGLGRNLRELSASYREGNILPGAYARQVLELGLRGYLVHAGEIDGPKWSREEIIQKIDEIAREEGEFADTISYRPAGIHGSFLIREFHTILGRIRLPLEIREATGLILTAQIIGIGTAGPLENHVTGLYFGRGPYPRFAYISGFIDGPTEENVLKAAQGRFNLKRTLAVFRRIDGLNKKAEELLENGSLQEPEKSSEILQILLARWCLWRKPADGKYDRWVKEVLIFVVKGDTSRAEKALADFQEDYKNGNRKKIIRD